VQEIMEITTIQFLIKILIDYNYGYERDARTSGEIKRLKD
jgi:hypothetical protein